MKQFFSIISATAFLFFSFTFSLAQKNSGNIFEKGTDEYKMFMAKQDFFSGDYRSAVNKYKEVLKNRPADASVQYYIGECYFMMREYNAALEFLEMAKNMNPAVNESLGLILGRTYHSKGMLDKALTELTAYRQSIVASPKKTEDTEIDLYITQCNTARQLMAKPVNATVIPLIEINSLYEDKGPVLTNDDKTLVFTSRRPTGDKSMTDKQGDFGYYDDVYESYWSDEKKIWLQADMIRGPINSEGYDACNSISHDGMTMFIYRNDPTAARGGEIFMSKKASSGKWKTPEIMLKPINTSYYEDGACLSPDGSTLYFISERPGGMGKGDIWISKKLAGGNWAEPVNAGAPVNTPYDENGLFIYSDGKTLFFCSNSPASMGSHDIFKTTIANDGKFSAPVNLGYPINSVGIESKFVLTADKKTAYISSVRDSGIGERDIIMIDVSNYDVFTGTSPAPAPAKSSLNGKIMSAEGAALSVEIRIIEKTTGSVVAMTKSAQDGSYSVNFDGNEQFVFEITAEGYQKISENISVPAGKIQSKNITLIKNN
ncbi:MAG: tetratricopeptide repeat protein [Bacteroidetes bacterium]|nr:MAG: tetratricopeptide repeat protein [Bacteroidota bacterium]